MAKSPKSPGSKRAGKKHRSRKTPGTLRGLGKTIEALRQSGRRGKADTSRPGLAATGQEKVRRKRVRRSPEESKALILAATFELIDERSPDQLGLVAVAKRAGVSHALINHYFGSMDNLLETALTEKLRERREKMMEQLPEVLEQGPDAILQVLFENVREPRFARMVAWAVLSGRMSAHDFGPVGLGTPKKLADSVAPLLAEKLGVRVSRERLEMAIVIGASASIGYALAADAMWRGAGTDRTPQLDASIRKTLSRMIRTELEREADDEDT